MFFIKTGYIMTSGIYLLDVYHFLI